MASINAKWYIDAELAKRFNKETKEANMMPNKIIEQLLRLWLEAMLPKLKEGGKNGNE